MKLATLRTASRDGALAVVSRDLTRLTTVPEIAASLQQALEDWGASSPRLQEVSDRLNAGQGPSELFDADRLMAPLPRAPFVWDGSTYLRHMELMGKWAQRTVSPSVFVEPVGYVAGPPNIGPTQDIVLPPKAEMWGIDFEAEIAVITDDVPLMSTAAEAADHIRLVVLMNDVSLRNLIPRELEKGFGTTYAKPMKAFSPVAVTPDELGEAWDGNHVHLPILSTLRGEPFGRPNAGEGSLFGFNELVAFLTDVRDLPAGSIVAAGTVSNLDHAAGSSCIAERRVLDGMDGARELTPWMRFGDRIRIEMNDAAGNSIFGAIDQAITAAGRSQVRKAGRTGSRMERAA